MESKIGHQIGHGQFGRVYTLRDAPHVVVKKVKYASKSAHVEYENLRRLRHPHILTVSHVTREGPYLYLQFPRYSGSLREAIPRGGLDVWIVGVYMRQLSGALAYCHEMHMMHRDVKPDNILVDPTAGRLVLGDFGLSKSWTRLMRTHTFPIGTLAYNAPELLFDQVRDYDEGIDVWALGCVYAEMILGHSLFYGKTMREMVQMVLLFTKTHVAFAKIPREDDAIWRTMMARAPKSRASAQDCLRAFRGLDNCRWESFFSTNHQATNDVGATMQVRET